MKSSLNRIFRIIWSDALGAWIAVSEITKGKGKRSVSGLVRKPVPASIEGLALTIKPLVFVLACGLALNAHANPLGGTVVNGQASISAAGNTLTVTNTPGTIINWQGFSIRANETTRFVQQSAASAVLNRVTGANPSNILGTLQSNGHVFLVNPNGIFFGASATVDVAGMVATSLNLSNANFLAGQNKFSQNANAKNISNAGNLTAQDGGQIYLIAPNVENTGVITAPNGEILLAAGNSVELVNTTNPNLRVSITAAAGNATNVGQLVASAGSHGLFGAIVKNTGIISADSATLQGGKIVLKASQRVDAGGTISAQGAGGGSIAVLADMQSGTANVSGTLDASVPVSVGLQKTSGGFIETSAAHVNIADTAKVTTASAMGLAGSWLIDPFDFRIAATGGDITGAALGTALGVGNVTITTLTASATCVGATCGAGVAGNGDIFVNDTVSWAANTLTLNAFRNININSAMNGGAAGKLALLYGQGAAAAGNTATYNVNAAVNLPAGANFSTTLGLGGTPINYTVITALGAAGSVTTTDLQGMRGGLGLNYALGANIDATTTNTWNAGAGFAPVGTTATPFTGTFDGLGHTVSNLTISLPTTNNNVGLFGDGSATAVIRNVGLAGGSVRGNWNVGGLVGKNLGTITNSYSTGAVNGSGYVGGLVGMNYGGSTISNSYSTGAVNGGGSRGGGLVGYNSGAITNSYSTGAVSGGNFNGGLVGTNRGTIGNSYSTGTVSGSSYVGGLVGYNYTGTISNSYSTSAVSGSVQYVGGLAGMNKNIITNCYSTGTVTGGDRAGGLAGYNWGGTISNCYSTGWVTGTVTFGGLVAVNWTGIISNSYWDTVTSGQATSAGGLGRTTAQFFTAASFTGFTFGTVGGTANQWVIVDADGTLNNAAAAAGNTRPMLLSEYNTTIANAHQLQLMQLSLAGSYTLAANIDATATNGTTNPTGVWGSSGFVPVGNVTTPFTGTFDGASHTISTLTINRSATNNVGLFGYTNTGSIIRNVGIVGGSVSGASYVGGLVGFNTAGTISNSYTTGSVSGTTNSIGGLVGFNSAGTVSNSYATGNVSSTGTGGIGLYVGGLVGRTFNASVSNSYATGSVTGNDQVGGLLGWSDFGTTSNSYATGSVVSANLFNFVGGLVGKTTGNVASAFTNCFWNTTTSGKSTSAGGTGMATADMMNSLNFTSATVANGNVNPAWDFTNTWISYNGLTYPLLRSFMTPLTVTASNATKTYDGLVYTASGLTYSTTPNSNLLGTLNYGGAINVGTYTASGLYSNQQGYIISYVGGSLTINAAPLTAISLSGTRAYDGTTNVNANIFTLSGLMRGETLSLTGTGTIANKNVGTYSVTLGSLALGNGTGLASNYTFTGGTQTATIIAASLGVTATAASKTYDGLAYTGGNGVTYSGFVNGETATVLGGTLAYGGTAQNAINAGSYLITPSGLTSGNYTLSYTSGALTVNKAALGVTANAATKTYDGLAYTGGNGVSYSGFVNGETTAVLGGTLAYGGTAQNAINAGSYLITASGLTSGNYTLSYTSGALTVNKAALGMTASAATKTYDGLAYTGGNGVIYSGFVNGETTAVLGGTLAYGGTAQNAINAGSYLIMPGGVTSGNYTLSYTSGALTVNKAALGVTASAATKTYDGLAYTGGNGVIYSGFVNGETTAVLGGTLAYGGTAQNAINAGSYLITPGGVTSGNYTLSYTSGALTVNKAALGVTANAATKTYDGLAYTGGNGVSYSGFVNGETSSVLGGALAYIGTSQNAINTGSYLITPSGLISSNYMISNLDGTLTIVSVTSSPAAVAATAPAASPSVLDTLNTAVANIPSIPAVKTNIVQPVITMAALEDAPIPAPAASESVMKNVKKDEKKVVAEAEKETPKPAETPLSKPLPVCR